MNNNENQLITSQTIVADNPTPSFKVPALELIVVNWNKSDNVEQGPDWAQKPGLVYESLSRDTFALIWQKPAIILTSFYTSRQKAQKLWGACALTIPKKARTLREPLSTNKIANFCSITKAFQITIMKKLVGMTRSIYVIDKTLACWNFSFTKKFQILGSFLMSANYHWRIEKEFSLFCSFPWLHNCIESKCSFWVEMTGVAAVLQHLKKGFLITQHRSFD